MTQFDLRLEAVGKSDRGVKRTNNEDAFAIHLPNAERPDALFMVADGIGGLSKGEVASRLTLETILSQYFTASPDIQTSGKLDPGARLLGALQVANQEVLSKAMASMDRMGSTVAGILIDFRRQATVFNVGDSRVYRIRNGAIAQLSQDQVLDIPAAPAEQGGAPKRTSKLLFFIGQNRPLEPYFERFTVQPGDSFVLCSDGLWSLVKSQEILELLKTRSAENAANHLIELARQRGAPDNVTVVIVHTRELQNTSLLPLAIAGTLVVALAAIGVVFSQSRNVPQAVSAVQTEAASTINALQGSATITPTMIDTNTPIPPTASFTASATATPTIDITETRRAALVIQSANETADVKITETAQVQASASVEAQVATDAVSTISAAAISTSGAQATGTMIEGQVRTRVAGTQTAIASFTPSLTPSSTSTASLTPSETPTETATTTVSLTPSISPTVTASATNTPTFTRTTRPSATPRPTSTPRPSATPTLTETVATQPPFMQTLMSRASMSPSPMSTPTEMATQTSTSETTPVDTIKTVVLADGTSLTVDPDITYQLFSGTRKVYKGIGSRYGIVTEINAGSYKYPVLARLAGSFLWYLILLPDNQTGWIAVPKEDNFAKIEPLGDKTLVEIPQLLEPILPTVTNTPSK